MRISNKVDKDLKAASEVQDQAYSAIEQTIENLAVLHKDTFPENPSLLPSLYVASMCLYINSIISAFPAECRGNLIMLVCKTLGFEDVGDDIEEDEETTVEELDLATMKIAGHA